jgi:hypothetical protein
MHRILRGIFTDYPEGSHAIDWGAGTGDLTSLMLEHFGHVYAVEPHPRLRAVLAGRCPGARILDGTLISASPPEPVEVGVISHVFYHVPDHVWGAYTIHAAKQLSQDGVLVVTLKDPDSGCNRMLKHFGAPHYDLYAGLAGAIRLHPELDFSFTHVPASITTSSLEDTLSIARFMLCDRAADAFSRPPTEDEFQEYVRGHFWDERTGTGGWQLQAVVCLVRRNPLYGPRPNAEG